MFQHTAARRRLGIYYEEAADYFSVSTHSGPKAAGCAGSTKLKPHWSFNTQPPEGGWRHIGVFQRLHTRFNTQPPEGGWLLGNVAQMFQISVSTHSRPKAAG